MSPRSLTQPLQRQHPPQRRESFLDLIGNTPLVRLRRVGRELPDGVELWAKLELLNPGGSVKDRPARQIILDAMERGELDGSKRLLDATSGNTGIAYAMIGAALDLDVTLVMPANVSPARKHIVQTYGAEIVYSSELEGSDGAIRKARELVAEHPERYFYADQYANPSNPGAHEQTTAAEIWEQTDGRITHFVTSTGTSGTLMGVHRGLKRFNPKVQVVGAQPADGFHGLEGLKHMASSIVPDIYDASVLDGMLGVETEDGWDMAERLACEEGIACGNSSGANVWAAMQVARELHRGVVVTVICDHADRYFGG